jgi:hypothetical protein
MRPFGWLGAILGLMVVLAAGAIGFALGSATTIPAGTTVTHVAWGWPVWGFPFFPLFGFLFLVLLIALVARGARRAAWAGRGPAGPGPWGWHAAGAWTPEAGDPPVRMFEEWHRRAHGSDGAGPAGDAAEPTRRPDEPPVTR